MSLARIDDKGDRLLVVNANTTRRGALSPDLYDALRAAFELAKDRRIRAVILTSEGGFFCAGGDLSVLISRRDLTETERQGKIEELHDLLRLIRSSPVPVIAAVEGGAAGAGLSLALACDLIVASETAKFTAAYVKAGLVPDGGLTSALSRIIPRPLAMEMCLLGQAVPAAKFAALGAITSLCKEGQAETEAMALADAIAKGPRKAQGVIRQLVSTAYEASEYEQLGSERDAMAHAAGGEEAAEGIAAFLEKRPPNFGD